MRSSTKESNACADQPRDDEDKPDQSNIAHGPPDHTGDPTDSCSC